MTSALDRGSQLSLLLCAEASLALWLDLTVRVDVTLQNFDIFVVKVGNVVFESFILHASYLR